MNTHVLDTNQLCVYVCEAVYKVSDSDEGIKKVSIRTGKPEKIASSPEHCFIFNDDIKDVKCPSYLNKDWYISLARKRLNDYGINY